jgi:hypothetical protein
MANRALLQMDQAEPAYQEFLRHFGERCKKPKYGSPFPSILSWRSSKKV